MRSSPVISHSIAIDGHRTSVSLEDMFWTALKEIAKQRGESLQHLVTNINANRQSTNLSSAIRMFVLKCYKERIAELEQQEIPQAKRR